MPPPFQVRVLAAQALVPTHATKAIRTPMAALFQPPSLRLCPRPPTLQGASIFIISSEPIVLIFVNHDRRRFQSVVECRASQSILVPSPIPGNAKAVNAGVSVASAGLRLSADCTKAYKSLCAVHKWVGAMQAQELACRWEGLAASMQMRTTDGHRQTQIPRAGLRFCRALFLVTFH